MHTKPVLPESWEQIGNSHEFDLNQELRFPRGFDSSIRESLITKEFGYGKDS